MFLRNNNNVLAIYLLAIVVTVDAVCEASKKCIATDGAIEIVVITITNTIKLHYKNRYRYV